MREVALSSDGIPVAFKVYGSGTPTLVFVHGWSCDRTYWRSQLGHFSERHQVVAIDLAGHGESGTGRASWTMAAFGEDVVAVLEQVGVQETVLIGHSMGGDVIVETALRLPSLVSGVVWVDTYRSLDEPRTREEIQAFLVPFRNDFVPATRELVREMFLPDADPGLVEWVAADMASAPSAIALDAMEHAISNDGPIVARLRELTASVMAINPGYRPTDIEDLRRHGVETVVMPGVGHFLMLEDPDGFNRTLGDVIHAFPE